MNIDFDVGFFLETNDELVKKENELRKLRADLALVQQKMDIGNSPSMNLPEQLNEMLSKNSQLQNTLLALENQVATLKAQNVTLQREQQIAEREAM